MYRLLIPKILPKNFDRVIYLDADTIINLDISELWNIDLENFSIAATPQILAFPDLNVIRNGIQIDSVEIDPHDYFNAGVLLFDLSKIRKFPRNLFSSSIKILLQNPRNISLDQDALNIIFKTNFLKLPSKFNNLVSWFYRDSSSKILHEIYHYIGDSLGIDLHFAHNRLWFDFFLKTPFYDSKTFKNLLENFDSSLQHCAQKIENMQSLFLKVLKLTANRRRVFLIYPANEESIFEIFGRAEDDIVINAMRSDAILIILKMFQKFRDVMTLFICISPEVFPQVHETLLSADLQMNEDFFNVFDLILPQHAEFNGNKVIRGI